MPARSLQGSYEVVTAAVLKAVLKGRSMANTILWDAATAAPHTRSPPLSPFTPPPLLPSPAVQGGAPVQRPVDPAQRPAAQPARHHLLLALLLLSCSPPSSSSAPAAAPAPCRRRRGQPLHVQGAAHPAHQPPQRAAARKQRVQSSERRAPDLCRQKKELCVCVCVPTRLCPRVCANAFVSAVGS